MNEKNLLFQTSLILVLLASMFSVTAQTVSADAPAPDKQTAKFENTFMEGMIDHHSMAIMMAEMCLEKAVHPELVATCGISLPPNPKK